MTVNLTLGSFSQRLEEAALEEETLKSHVWEARCALESARQDYQAVREVYELFTSKLNGCLRLHQVPGVATDSASDEQLSLTSGDTVIRCLDRHLMRCEEDEIANLLQSMFRTIESTEHFSAPVISQKSDNEHGTANKHQDTVNAETQTTKDYEATLDVADVSAAPLEALTDGCSVDGPDYTEAVHVTRDDRSAIGDPETVTFGDSLTVTPQKVGCRATNHRSVADLDIDVTAVETEIPQVAALRLQLTNQTDENETLRVSLTQVQATLPVRFSRPMCLVLCLLYSLCLFCYLSVSLFSLEVFLFCLCLFRDLSVGSIVPLSAL
eukprot:GHVQ01027804.1.p1 GENE.GHVQ01027804.1~~GHVQ01027804.1.p1  ORF type:complete len:324 (+),score=34.19 GHVQ01027804.1:1161-2132(+)